MKNPSDKHVYVNYTTIEQLNKEARTRANNDTILANAINNLATDYENNKEANTKLLTSKQNKVDSKLTTASKNIVEAINELNAKYSNSSSKDDREQENEQWKVKVALLSDLLKKTEAQLAASVYRKFQEATVADNSYLFADYDEDYWHIFIVEFEAPQNIVSGILERPSGLNPDISSHNVIVDYETSTSFNLVFSGINKTLEIKKWDQNNQKINKVTIYRKKILF